MEPIVPREEAEPVHSVYISSNISSNTEIELDIFMGPTVSREVSEPVDITGVRSSISSSSHSEYLERV